MSYVLGIDGGGTKTVGIAADMRGNVLGRGISGASNYQTVGLDQAIAAIEEASEQAARAADGKCEAVCLGLAGVARERDRSLLLPAIEKLDLAEKIILEHDAAIALAGALACEPGVVVLAGTGAMAFGINCSGEKRRANGWGNVLGDEGSAYYMGRRALTAACKAYDGRGPETMLMERLMEHLDLNEFTDIVREIYGKQTPSKDVASIAPLVSKAAKDGDDVAVMILKDAAEELALAAIAVIKGLNMQNETFPIAISGSVFNAGEPLLKPFSQRLKSAVPNAEIIAPKFEPAMGAVFLALRNPLSCAL